MIAWKMLAVWIVVVNLLFVAWSDAAEHAQDSAIANAAPGLQRLLLNSLDDPASIGIAAWKMDGTFVRPNEEVLPKLGLTALTFGALQAEQPGPARTSRQTGLARGGVL